MYSRSNLFTASLLLISIFLQSCNPFEINKRKRNAKPHYNNKVADPPCAQSFLPKSPLDLDTTLMQELPLLEQINDHIYEDEFIVGGTQDEAHEAITFYKEADTWKAKINESYYPLIRSRTVSVVCARNMNVETLKILSKKQAQHFIHKIDQGKQPSEAFIYIGKAGLTGGMMEDNEEDNTVTANDYFNQGNSLYDLGNYLEVVVCYDAAIKINPNYVEAYNNKGVTLYNLGRYLEAIGCYDAALKINSNYAEAYNNKGSALYNLGRYLEAIGCYDAAIKINPNYVEAYNNKGNSLYNLGKKKDNSLYALGKYLEAIGCYDVAIQTNPNCLYSYNNKGNVLCSLGKYLKAIGCYDAAIKINSKYAESYNNKGSVLYSLGRYLESIECYDAAIKINSNDVYACNGKGNALYALGKYFESIKCYNAVLRIKPN